MKKYLSFVVLTILFYSCSNSSIPYHDDVVEHVRRNTKNPDSFELDSVVYDPLTYLEELKSEYSSDSSDIFWYESSQKELKYVKVGFEKMVWPDGDISLLHDYFLFSDEVQESQFIYDSLKTRNSQDLNRIKNLNSTKSDSVILHRYKVYFMGQNSFGAIERHLVSVEVNPEMKPFGNGETFYLNQEEL